MKACREGDLTLWGKAAQDVGIKPVEQVAGEDAQRQSSQVDTCIAQKVNGIVSIPWDNQAVLQDIERARARIKDDIYMSPCAYSETFSKLPGNKVHFKLENLQMTGSFKERGALNNILTLTDGEQAKSVYAA